MQSRHQMPNRTGRQRSWRLSTMSPVPATFHSNFRTFASIPSTGRAARRLAGRVQFNHHTQMNHSKSTEETPALLCTTPLSIVRMLWNQKWLLLGVWVTLSMLAALMVRHLRPIYRAEAVVLVDSQKIPERYVSSTVNSEVQDRLAALSQRILSFTNLRKIIDDFALYR